MPRKNDTLVISLCVALVVAVLIIAYLMWGRSSPSPRPEPRRAPEPMPMPQPPPSAPTPRPSPPAIVLFYSDGCGHCQQMKPAWEKAKSVLSPMLQVLEFEPGQNAAEVKANKIPGFPSVRLYPEGFPSPNYIEYKGNRSTDSLIKFVQSRGQES